MFPVRYLRVTFQKLVEQVRKIWRIYHHFIQNTKVNSATRKILKLMPLSRFFGDFKKRLLVAFQKFSDLESKSVDNYQLGRLMHNIALYGSGELQIISVIRDFSRIFYTLVSL